MPNSFRIQYFTDFSHTTGSGHVPNFFCYVIIYTYFLAFPKKVERELSDGVLRYFLCRLTVRTPDMDSLEEILQLDVVKTTVRTVVDGVDVGRVGQIEVSQFCGIDQCGSFHSVVACRRLK